MFIVQILLALVCFACVTTAVTVNIVTHVSISKKFIKNNYIVTFSTIIYVLIWKDIKIILLQFNTYTSLYWADIVGLFCFAYLYGNDKNGFYGIVCVLTCFVWDKLEFTCLLYGVFINKDRRCSGYYCCC